MTGQSPSVLSFCLAFCEQKKGIKATEQYMYVSLFRFSIQDGTGLLIPRIMHVLHLKSEQINFCVYFTQNTNELESWHKKQRAQNTEWLEFFSFCVDSQLIFFFRKHSIHIRYL